MNSVKPKIYIYSGKVHSGKTTNILEWTKTKKSIDGILAPVIDSKRYLYRIKSKEYHLLEADEKEDKNKIISVGNYKFRENIFSWAQKELDKAFLSEPEWLIIDEIGFLELRNEGLEPAVRNIIRNRNSVSTNILLIIRDNLVNDALKNYNLKSEDYEFINI